MRQIQNRDNQACNSNDNHKLFVCTHKHPLLCKTQGEECSRPTGCRGKYIICASAILRAGGAGEGHSLRWKAAIGERKIAFELRLFPFAVIVHKVNIMLPTFRCDFYVYAIMRGHYFQWIRRDAGVFRIRSR